MKFRDSSANQKAKELKNAQGSALIIVFWIISVLALAVFAAVRVVYHDAEVTSSQVNGYEAFLAAERGIAIAANPAVERTDPLLNWQDASRDIAYRARITSEASHFNINAILMRKDKQLLIDIFTSWGLEIDDAQMVVDNLVDWVDGGDLEEMNGAEKEWYEAQGKKNQPFNRPFYSLDEMRLVKDMDKIEAVNPQWRDWFTVWSEGKLDLNEAKAELIAAATGVTIEKAEDLIDRISGPDGVRDTEDDLRFQSSTEALTLLGVSKFQMPIVSARVTVKGKVTRIVSVGRAGTVKQRITLVIKNRKTHPVILDRKEEIVP